MKNLKKFLLLCLTFGLAFTAVVTPVTTHATSTVSTTEGKVASYEQFISCLKLVEEYATEYARFHTGEDKTELVINYVRTGVERYKDGIWAILAGEQNDEFVNFVKVQDEVNGTNASNIRNLVNFTIPNNEDVDFGHMFATMNITYMAKTNLTATEIYADLGGWARDLIDLMEGTVEKVSQTTDVDAMVKELADKYKTTDYGFDIVDICSDLDAYYIMQNVSSSKSISVTMVNYFNKFLTPVSRARFFVANRFGDIYTKEELRGAIYDAYSNNAMIKEILEYSKGLTTANWPAKHLDTLRQAVCYVFADYLFDLTGPITEYEENDVYSVYDVEESTLAPGITQQIKTAYAASDGKQLSYCIAISDVTRDDVHVFANYKDNDPSLGWGMSRVMDQIQAAIKNHTNPNSDKYIENYNPVVATNGDFFNMDTGKPTGALVMEGVTYNAANGENFFAILKDGTPVIGGPNDWAKYEGQIKEAIGGSVYLVKNGRIVVPAGGERASRTVVGITADNKVVMMALDGRQEPYSAGGTFLEQAQIMYDAGCVVAINIDGGGSTTYISKKEGEDELSIINSPSDGTVRSVSSSLMVVSTAKPSHEFSHALVTSDAEYLTVGTTVNVDMMGVSVSGEVVELPAGAKLQLSNTTVGTLDNGVFTAMNNGSVDVQVVVNGTVVGKKTLRVVNPDSMIFEKESMNLIYGQATELPVKATYKGNFVKINANDVVFKLSNEKAGTLDGFTFTGSESSKVRTVFVRAILKANLEANTDHDGSITYEDKIQLDLYKTGEVSFDFENATAGDRHLAFNRVLNNTTTNDGQLYNVVDTTKGVEGSYTFGLDMKMIEMPEILRPLVGDLLGENNDVTTWDFLLQLAEHINPLTEVVVTLNVDPNFDLDISEVTLVNEYFRISSKEYDPDTNTLTIKFNWIDQTTAIDASTANSICILSGIKFTPKAGTPELLEAKFNGNVTYDVYLSGNAIYNLANNETFQEQFNIYPYINPTNSNDKGGHFADTLAIFKDSFTLNREGKKRWYKESDGCLYYYVNNKPVTGIQKLPAYLQEGKELYYEFDEKGALLNREGISGKFVYNNGVYFAAKGELKTGWQTVKGNDKTNYYYFGEDGKAVNGTQTIDGYTYKFEDYILVRGHVLTDSKGTRYVWAGQNIVQKWVEIDGRLTYIQRNGYFPTGMQKVYDAEGVYQTVFFGEDGFVVDVTGLYEYEGQIYLVEKGFMVPYPGLVYIDGYYYYFNSSNTAVRNKTYYISKPNGLLPQKSYPFDENGRMIIEIQEQPKPEQPEKPEEDDKDENTNGSILRIFGEDRYETAYNVADSLKANLGIEKFDTIIIATGLEYADALTGSYLANAMNAPILLTAEKHYESLVAYIEANVELGGTVYILGGEKALPASLDAMLSNYNVVRLAGATRYETNLLILKEVGVTSGQDLFLATGINYADSLAVSATGKPIMLVNPIKGLLVDQVEFLSSVGFNNLYVLGGEKAISAEIESLISIYGKTTRIGGATRCETSVLIAERFFSGTEYAVLAYAWNYPDGLAAGPLGYALHAPIILTSSQVKDVPYAKEYIKDNIIKSGMVIGGSKLITDSTVTNIFNVSDSTPIEEKKY